MVIISEEISISLNCFFFSIVMCVLSSTERISLKKSGVICCAYCFLAFICESGLWPSMSSSDCLGLVFALYYSVDFLFLSFGIMGFIGEI